MGIKSYLAKRKMKQQFIKEGVMSPGPSLGYRYRESKFGKGQKAVYGFLEDIRTEGQVKGKKGKKGKNPFGKLKDRSFFEGGFF